MIPVATVILAGGKSRRMGTDKALLPCRGTTLLDIALQTAVQTGFPVYVSTAPDRSYDLPSGISRIPDRYAGIGPLGGIASCLEQIPSETLIFIPVDMPLLQAELLRKMVEMIPASASALAVQTGRRIYPLPLVLRQSALNAIKRQIDRNDFRLYSLLDRIPAKIIVRPGWEPYFANLNTPDDRQICNE